MCRAPEPRSTTEPTLRWPVPAERSRAGPALQRKPRTRQDENDGDEGDRRREGRHDPGVDGGRQRRPRHGRARPARPGRPGEDDRRPTATRPCRSPTAPGTPASSPSPRPGSSPRPASTPATRLVELRLDDVSSYEVGAQIGADTFEAGERVDVTAVSKGKGFAGADEAPRLQGPAGLPRRPPRAPGSRLDRRLRHAVPGVQGHEDGRVAWVASGSPRQNLEVVKADAEAGVVLVRGSVPGPDGGVVLHPQRRQVHRIEGWQVMAGADVRRSR